jgi:uncharacterized protein
VIPVCIFAKAPRAGAVKTRLAAAIGAETAAHLAAAFLQDTWALVRSRVWARPVIAAAGTMQAELLEHLPGAEIWDQGEGELDARIERVLTRASGPAIALGADSPALPAAWLDEAADELAAGRAVVGPAEDGGFYLLGLPACPPGLLGNVRWSEPSTCADVIAQLTARGLATTTLRTWFDIDRGDDLAMLSALLARAPNLAPATARALGNHR